MAGDGSRRSYLLDGRRVRVRDLLDARLVETGQPLKFVRPRSGETHAAIVEESGALLVDGRAHATPSAAARAATGAGEIDGWTAWTTDSGATLHALRLQLLDNVAAEAAATDPVGHEEHRPESPLPRHQFLKHAREAAERGNPETITVRDLVRLWGVQTRDSRVSLRIAADLENHGLTTEPNFLSVTLDDEVVLAAVRPDPGPVTFTDSGVGTDSVTVEVTPTAQMARREIGLTLGNLVQPWRTLEWVKPTATVEEALTKMLVNDYSQLPVLKNRYSLEGAVTWQSIARARLKDPQAPLSAAIVEATKLSYSDDLHKVLPKLQDEDFIVVANPHNEITGIVTTADVVALYHERTLPFLLIGELDQELRQLIEATIPFDTVRAVCAQPGRPELESFDDMTMGDYQQVLGHPGCWATLGWPLDRVTFVKRVDDLRRIRNDITHFNPDPEPKDAVDKLRHMLDVIRTFGPAADS
jgi:CBS domain-containing protein